ncbi:MAG: DUF2175 family protein, partial [Methanomassiliicoccales archaeon]
MAEFKCYECGGPVKSGEKFTFTKQGSVHLDCFVSSKRKGIDESKLEAFRHLTQVLDSELQHMILLFSMKSQDERVNQLIKNKIKEIEKASGETTRAISEI